MMVGVAAWAAVPQAVLGTYDDDDEEIHLRYEQAPMFPGGIEALGAFLSENLQYPPRAAELGLQGTVLVRFVVRKNGSIDQVEVIRSENDMLDEEAVRVCRLLPRFTPGEIDGKPVSVYYTLPIKFHLSDYDLPDAGQ